MVSPPNIWAPTSNSHTVGLFHSITRSIPLFQHLVPTDSQTGHSNHPGLQTRKSCGAEAAVYTCTGGPSAPPGLPSPVPLITPSMPAFSSPFKYVFKPRQGKEAHFTGPVQQILVAPRPGCWEKGVETSSGSRDWLVTPASVGERAGWHPRQLMPSPKKAQPLSLKSTPPSYNPPFSHNTHPKPTHAHAWSHFPTRSAPSKVTNRLLFVKPRTLSLM